MNTNVLLNNKELDSLVKNDRALIMSSIKMTDLLKFIVYSKCFGKEYIELPKDFNKELLKPLVEKGYTVTPNNNGYVIRFDSNLQGG